MDVKFQSQNGLLRNQFNHVRIYSLRKFTSVNASNGIVGIVE